MMRSLRRVRGRAEREGVIDCYRTLSKVSRSKYTSVYVCSAWNERRRLGAYCPTMFEDVCGRCATAATGHILVPGHTFGTWSDYSNIHNNELQLSVQWSLGVLKSNLPRGDRGRYDIRSRYAQNSLFLCVSSWAFSAQLQPAGFPRTRIQAVHTHKDLRFSRRSRRDYT